MSERALNTKAVVGVAAGIGTLLAGGLAGRRLVDQWAKNEDPLDGEPVEFPDGEQRVVTMRDGAQISTVSVGTGPTIVCVHGLTTSRHDWGPIAATLVDAGYRLVAIEQRGHGDSTPGTAGYGSTQLGEDLAAVMAELDLRPQALVGHSMGGMAVMAYAAHHHGDAHDRVDNLVLIATAGSLKTARHGIGLRLGSIEIPPTVMPENERLRLVAGLSVFGKRPSLHMIDEIIAIFGECPEDVRTQATEDLLDHDVLAELADVTLRTLVLGGTRDQLIRPHQVRELDAALPNSTLHMFDGAGHMVIWERHHDVADAILQMIRPDYEVATGGLGRSIQPLQLPT